jgi:hypothetical protein
MPYSYSLLWRVAGRIHRRLSEVRRSPFIVDLQESLLEECQRLVRQVRRARQLKFPAAEQRLRMRLSRNTDRLADHFRGLPHVIREFRAASVCSVRDVADDLAGLQNEFDTLHIDHDAKTISVVTEPVVLEGVELGRFAIILTWSLLPSHGCYCVKALDPEPAGRNPEVTHPHVQEDLLCEGDGAAAIRQSLDAGRLLDFFTVVYRILFTYRKWSAYVPLSDWHDKSCHDCGATVPADDQRTCENCDSDLCQSCHVACPECGEVNCFDCTTACTGCNNRYCKACLTKCTTCHFPFCQECRADEQCHSCFDAEDDAPHDELDESTEVDESANIAVHALCVGEAAVPA